MDLPAVVRSTHTWDTRPGRDLREGEEAIVVSAVDLDGDLLNWSDWVLIPLDKPRLITLRSRSSVSVTLKRWLKPT
jgi:hypothetical protein